MYIKCAIQHTISLDCVCPCGNHALLSFGSSYWTDKAVKKAILEEHIEMWTDVPHHSMNGRLIGSRGRVTQTIPDNAIAWIRSKIRCIDNQKPRDVSHSAVFEVLSVSRR